MKTAHDLVMAAKTRTQEVALTDADEAIRDADVLIDVREADEFAAGHLPGALHISRGLLEFKLSGDPQLSARDLKLVVYCKTGGRAALAACALTALLGSPEARILPIGLPDLPFHVRVDALSAFFLLLLGAAGAGISIYAAGYLRPGEGTAPGLHCLLYHLFLASMVGVLVADDGYAFMVAWETMALSSYFLVVSEHRHAEIRRAGYLYLLLAHIGAVTGRLDVDRVRRTVAELTSLRAARERQFADLGIDSMTTYRQARRDGSVPADRFPTDVFLVIDGWGTVRSDFDDLEQRIMVLAGRALTFGVHLLVTASRWLELRQPIKDVLGSDGRAPEILALIK